MNPIYSQLVTEFLAEGRPIFGLDRPVVIDYLPLMEKRPMVVSKIEGGIVSFKVAPTTLSQYINLWS